MPVRRKDSAAEGRVPGSGRAPWKGGEDVARLPGAALLRRSRVRGRPLPGSERDRSGATTSTVFRVLLCVTFMLLGPAGGGLLVSQVASACEEGCPDDSEDGRCDPSCSDCPCCAHVRLVALPADTRIAPAATPAGGFERLQTYPASAEPSDILHVPIAA